MTRLHTTASLALLPLLLAACGGGGGGGAQTAAPAALVPLATIGGTATPAPAISGPSVSTPPPVLTASAGFLTPNGASAYAGTLAASSTYGIVIGISQAEIGAGNPPPGETIAVQVGNGTPGVALQRRAAALHPAASEPAIRIASDGEADPGGSPALRALLRGAQHGARRTADAVGPAFAPATGSTRSFYVERAAIGSSGPGATVTVPAALAATTTHGNIWIDAGLPLTPAEVAAIGDDFENAYASDTTHFGTAEWTAAASGASAMGPQCDANGIPIVGAPLIPILIPAPNGVHNVLVVNTSALGSGVGGYFEPANAFRSAVANCVGVRSNELSLIVVGYNPANGSRFETQEDVVRDTAHEFQHLISFVNHFVLSPQAALEDRWINEGLSMLAQDLAVNRKFGLAIDVADAGQRALVFLGHPTNFSLTAFSGVDPGSSAWSANCSGCYGETYLFQRYLYDRFGDAYLHAVESGPPSFPGLQAASGNDPRALIADFAVALAATGLVANPDPRFTFAAFQPYGTYTDQFGTRTTFGGPTTIAQAAGSTQQYTFPTGTFGYIQIANASAGAATVAVSDPGGAFQLMAALVQR